MPINEELLTILAKIDEIRRIKRFLEELFTSAELKDVSLRWQLIKMLSDNIPQRDIASKLHISLCKITRGSKILKEPDSATRKMLDLLAENKL